MEEYCACVNERKVINRESLAAKLALLATAQPSLVALVLESCLQLRILSPVYPMFLVFSTWCKFERGNGESRI